MPAFSGISIWCGREFSIQNVEMLSTSDVLQYTYYPHETKENDRLFKRVSPDTPAEGDRVQALFECSGDNLWKEIDKRRMQTRVWLTCENDNRKIHVRWNFAKCRWSGYQKGWDTMARRRRLFVIEDEYLKRLTQQGGSWKFPSSSQEGYHEALPESAAVNSEGYCEVAAILEHKEVRGTLMFLIRWEDFDENTYKRKDKNDNMWRAEADFTEGDEVLAAYKAEHRLV